MITVLAKLTDAFGFLRFVFRRWKEDRCPQTAGSLTFTTLLALVPMFAIAVAVLSSAPFFEDAMSQIKIFLLLNLLPEIAYKIITVYMVEFAASAARLTWVGIVVVFVIATALMLLIDRSLNGIWRVRRSRPLWLSVPVYVLLLAVGPVLIGISVSVTTYLMSISAATTGLPREWNARALRIVPLSVSALAFFLMYFLIPQRRVAWQHAALGGVAAAVLFETAKELFAVYVRYAPTYNLVYGTFAAVPVFLIWIYLSWLIVLLGAELTASIGYARAGLWRRERSAGHRFRTAVAIVRELIDAAPKAVSVHRLREKTKLPVQEVEDTLMEMGDGGLVRREGRSGFALARSAAEVTFEDLYRATVGPIGGMRPEEWADVSPAFARAATEMRSGLGRTLSTLVEEAPARGADPAPAFRKAKRGRGRSARSSR
jgi:membrane protein